MKFTVTVEDETKGQLRLMTDDGEVNIIVQGKDLYQLFWDFNNGILGPDVMRTITEDLASTAPPPGG